MVENNIRCGVFFINGLIDVYHHNDEQKFKTLEETFFYRGFSSKNKIMKQKDWEIYLKYYLKDEKIFKDLKLKGKYSVQWNFDVTVPADYMLNGISINTYELILTKI
jgi:hypothetical protein